MRVDLEDVLEKMDIEQFLCDHDVDFRNTSGSSGPQLNVKYCPRCGNGEYKVYLNEETGLGNCFAGSCVDEPGFNKFTFARSLMHWSSGETVRNLVDYVESLGWIPPKARKKTFISPLVGLPASYLVDNEESKGKTWCLGRGLPSQLVRQFDLRYSDDGFFKYKDADGVDRKQDYSDRIIIPVFGLNGELVTFQGRDAADTGKKKYLFPPGLPGSGRFLFNGHNVIGKEEIIVNEGVFDVMATTQALSEHSETENIGVVGSFGISISGDVYATDDSQLAAFLSLQKDGLRTITMMWDGSRQATKAAIDACRKLRRVGLRLKLARLPLDKDPNEVKAIEVVSAYKQAVEATDINLIKLQLII